MLNEVCSSEAEIAFNSAKKWVIVSCLCYEQPSFLYIHNVISQCVANFVFLSGKISTPNNDQSDHNHQPQHVTYRRI